MENEIQDRVVTEVPKTLELNKENQELRAALTDLVKAYLILSQACGHGIYALNNHSKVVMSLGVDLNAGTSSEGFAL